MQWPVPLPEDSGTASATFSKLEMQHSPKKFCNFLEKSVAKNMSKRTFPGDTLLDRKKEPTEVGSSNDYV